ncbi:MAG: DNA-directed RNA polymerase subunit K [Nanoarchaeota archaeon]
MEKYTKFEKARMIGSRALQIGMGAPPLVKLNEDDMKRIKYNPIEIAKLEYDQGLIPITVKRPFPKAVVEKEEKKN